MIHRLLDNTNKVVFISQWIPDSAKDKFRKPLGPYVLQDHNTQPYNPPLYTPPATALSSRRTRMSPPVNTPSPRLPHHQSVDPTTDQSPPPTDKLSHHNRDAFASRLQGSTSTSPIDIGEAMESSSRGERRTREEVDAGANEPNDGNEWPPTPSKRARKLPRSFEGQNIESRQRILGTTVATEDEGYFQDVQSPSPELADPAPICDTDHDLLLPDLSPDDTRETITVAELFSRVRAIAGEDLRTDEEVHEWLLRDVRDFTPGKNGCIVTLNPAWKAKRRQCS
ncbi:hypothetical protein BC936DRAFT_149635 [Jimgerdemannia flammicorona]|uniref:Uncharacterized protein n=1 Tax=Jimgerdemannia flammicorona TaxID=994334 RepID=A0A433DJT1_9FUNG|nr:hypothetical protein BC936DRAFT_149635 [Jimgerdemannia flammicorona]